MSRMLSVLSASVAALALGACASDPIIAVPVPAVVETAPMMGVGDRADDPAVWVNPVDGAKSLILGTNKEEGLYVYGLDGRELQKLPVGRLNNIDVRGVVAVGSNDETEALSWFSIDADATVAHMGDTPTNKVEPYGICAGVVDGVYLAAPTYKDGMVQIWAADGDAEPGTVTAQLVRTVQLGGQLEGCVFDDAEKRLFIGEEEHGIWSLDLSDPESVPVSVDTIAAGNGLVMDVEGLSLWIGEEAGAGYLVASAQAKDRFVVYDRLPPHAVVGVVTVAPSVDGAIDAVTHTDGLDIVSAALPGYPKGVMVVQDDGNPESGVDQNFKVVDWRAIEAALGIAQ